MNSYVQLTLNEYDELKKIQVEATTLVEQTNKNLSRKLTEANEKVTELESDLRKYAIGGARIRTKAELEKELAEAGSSLSAGEMLTEKEADARYGPGLYKASNTPIDEEHTQTRSKAKLGRKRWTDYEVAFMKTHASVKASLSSVAHSLDRTVSSIKTQASRMGLSSSNGILSEVG